MLPPSLLSLPHSTVVVFVGVVLYPHFLDDPSYVCPGWPAVVLDATIADMQDNISTPPFPHGKNMVSY